VLADVPARMRQRPNYFEGLFKDSSSISKENLTIIEKDVRRTKGCYPKTEKEQFVRKILIAFVRRNPEIGYLQGFNFIVEFFWLKGFSEEASFWLFCHLIEDLISFEFFRNLTPLFADIKMFKYFLFFKNRKLFKSLMNYKIDLFFVIHKWFLVSFLNIDNLQVSP
jgi:hypothetical protein